MINLTFLEAKIGRLAKTVSPAGIEPYPNAAQFISHTDIVSSLGDFATKIRERGNAGHCLHVGGLIKPLAEWGRRAGLADRNTPLRWVVIDVDAIHIDRTTTALDATTFRDIAEDVIAQLQIPELNTTSCVAQASSKMGLTDKTVSMHLFYLLDKAVASPTLKIWLKNLNIESRYLKSNVRLSSNGHSLIWPLDVSSIDSGRLIYIAPPVFSGTANPFRSNNDRVVVLHKANAFLSADTVLQATPTAIRENKLKNTLRELAGLAPNEKPKLRTMTIGGERHELLLNPAPGAMRPHAIARGFCYYNLNEGDSGAYYHPEGKPDIVFNFKGEPAFRFEDVDAQAYQTYCDANQDAIAKATPMTQFMVVNQRDDQIYKVWHNREENTVSVVRSRREQITDFYQEYGMLEPEFLRTWQIDHWPQESYLIDYPGQTINLFVPSELMKAGQTRAYDTRPNYTDPTSIRESCPNTWFLINHVLGNGAAEITHFINWLAAIVQKRSKNGSAFILQGTEGTGKGTLYETILTPLLGAHNMTMKTNSDIADAFTGWRRGKLLVCFDEFEVANNTAGRKQLSTLRGWISEPRQSIREMHQEGRDYTLYDNFIFFTNQFNMLPIPEKERRYTICPRQETKLEELCNTEKLRQDIAAELAQFSCMLHAFEVDDDQLKRCLNNEAKSIARESAATMAEEFIIALKSGNLDFMMNIFECVTHNDPNNILNLDNARRTVIDMTRSRQSTQYFSVADLCGLYNAMFDQRLAPFAFGKMLSRHGMPGGRYGVGSERKRGYPLKMEHSTLRKSEIDEFLTNQRSHLKAVGE